MTSWLLLQLVDGAFPSGGFAHSAGLEPSLHLRGLGELEPFVDEAIWQTGRSALPFVRRACEAQPELATLASLDALFDASCTSHVQNRASRAQGRSLAGAASRVFDQHPGIDALGEHARRGPAHHAVVFGALFGTLGMSASDAQTAWLHGVLRSVLSAAVRLGVVGPLEAQQIQASRARVLDDVLASCGDLDVMETATTAPLLELFGALHDRLDVRLFQS